MLPNGTCRRQPAPRSTSCRDPTYGQIYRVVARTRATWRDTSQNYTSASSRTAGGSGSRVTINPGLWHEHQALTGTLTDLSLGNEWGPRDWRAPGIPRGTAARRCLGSWGRFYTRMPNDLAARSLSADAGVSRADYFDAALTQPIPGRDSRGRQRRRTSFSRVSPPT